jgi:hypothetical protein
MSVGSVDRYASSIEGAWGVLAAPLRAWLFPLGNGQCLAPTSLYLDSKDWHTSALKSKDSVQEYLEPHTPGKTAAYPPSAPRPSSKKQDHHGEDPE